MRRRPGSSSGDERMAHNISTLKILAVAGLDEIKVFRKRRSVVAHMQPRHEGFIFGA